MAQEVAALGEGAPALAAHERPLSRVHALVFDQCGLQGKATAAVCALEGLLSGVSDDGRPDQEAPLPHAGTGRPVQVTALVLEERRLRLEGEPADGTGEAVVGAVCFLVKGEV